jgi:lipoprotein-anchoring transpeptidase ErfK/SrfK
MTVRRVALAAAIAALVAGLVIAAMVGLSRQTARHTMSQIPRMHPTGEARHTTTTAYRPLPSAEIEALPEARYNAVIAGLMAATDPSADAGRSAAIAYSIGTDTPIYGVDRITPVGRFGVNDFLGGPTVVVPIEMDGDWARVLTPARKVLPSESGGSAPAQTAGWIRAEALIDPTPLPRRILVSIAGQTLTIVAGETVEQTFRVGVGMPSTPTPHGVTGYLQARYLDPAQNQARHPVQLTSLHSTTADEPFGGSDGGLIGMHYERTATGAVSHGCIRLSSTAIEAVDALPLGTPISIVP